MAKKLYISGIDWESIADGEGVRSTIFVSGCNHACEGCHNHETWNYKYGTPINKEIIQMILDNTDSDYIDGITLSGGCPMCNAEALLPVVKAFRKKYGKTKTIWSYCGEYFEDLIEDKTTPQYKLLKMIDVLVDSPFEIHHRNTAIAFRGSTNQRIIDVPISLKKGEPILLDYD